MNSAMLASLYGGAEKLPTYVDPLAMIRVDQRLRREFPESHLLLTVHDELVLETPGEGVERVAQALAEEMEGVATLDVPLAVDYAWGPTWYDAKS